MSELMPCPFCGHAPKLHREVDEGGAHHVIVCGNRYCRAQQNLQQDCGEYISEEHADRAWNTRPPTAADGVTEAQVDAALIAHWGPDALNPRLCSKGDRAAMRAALAAAMGVRS